MNKKIKMQKITIDEYISNIDTILATADTTICYYGILDDMLVHIGADECNLQYIREHNIKYKKLNRIGGTIVGTFGDIEFFYFINKADFKGFVPEAIKTISFIKKNSSHTATIDNNDILVDGYKVGSYCIIELNDKFCIAMVLSATVNLELIKAICKKPIIKEPAGLTNFNINMNELLNHLFPDAQNII